MNHYAKNLWPVGLIIAIAAIRLVPHMPNLAPITAIAIFSAATMSGRRAVALTFGARLLSDIFLGFFSWPLMIAVYGAHGIGLVLGRFVRRTEPGTWGSVPYGIMAGAGAAVLFFLITNFAFFYSIYPHTIEGVIAAYTNGLPFLRGTLLGDVGYTAVLFSTYALAMQISRRRVNLKQAKTLSL